MLAGKSLVLLVGAAALAAAAPTASTKTPISQALYAQFQRYTLFAAATYASSCPKPPNGAKVVKFFNVASTDTQAYLFRDDAAQEFIIAFRGSSSGTDFYTDSLISLVPITGATGVNCASCQVHEGVHKAW